MKPVLLAAVVAVLSGCSGPPVIEAGADPADASSRVKALRYRPVTAGTLDYRPVEPKPWAQRNELVTPRKGGQ